MSLAYQFCIYSVRRMCVNTLYLCSLTPSSQMRARLCCFHSTPIVSARRRRRDIGDKFVMGDDDLDPQWRAPESQDMEEMRDFIAADSKSRVLKLAEEKEAQRRQRSYVKNKVIERKYFREPKATNILTWRAKEQIRYLYSQNNNEDGIGTILDVFPISEQDLRKLLRSKQLMKNAADIENHDKRVRQKWENIIKADKLDGPLLQTIDNIIASGQVENFVNAGGAPDIQELGTPTLSQLANRVPVKPGPITSLLLKHGRTASTTFPKLEPKIAAESEGDNSKEESEDNPDKTILLKVLKQMQKQKSRQKSQNTDDSSQSDDYQITSDISSDDSADMSVMYENPASMRWRGKEMVNDKGEVIFRVP